MRNEKGQFQKGFKHTEETKKKISKTMFGKKKTLEHTKNIRKCQLGKMVSEETRKRISQTLLGSKNPEHSKRMKGRKVSEETKLKMSKAQKGEKNNSWKGGITPQNKLIRRSIEFRLWREAVFARDNWTCQKYGDKGGKLHSHHIQNFAEYPELRFAIDNGITLSKEAHQEFHKKYGIKNNTKEQIEEFLNK